MRCRLLTSSALLLSMMMFTPSASTQETQELLTTIKAVGPEGEGNPAAQKAWKKLVSKNMDALLPTLDAMGSANFRAQNWLRAAVNSIVSNAQKKNQSVPVNQLKTFLQKSPEAGAARKLAYDLIANHDPNANAELLPTFINDPSSELRRAAIAHQLKIADAQAKNGNKEAAKTQYQSLLAAARDEDQIEDIVKKLKPFGVNVDLQELYGFITRCYLITPFDSRNGIGYAKVYPPENEIDLSKTYEGKEGEKAKWQTASTTDPHGVFDLNEILGKLKGTVAYAYIVVNSPKAQPVEVRAGSITAIKLFLNGKEIFGREEYHHGMRLDQHVGLGTLKKGRNEILIKVCQNEQTERWAQKWQFQVRLTDYLGGPIPYTVVKPAKEEIKKEN